MNLNMAGLLFNGKDTLVNTSVAKTGYISACSKNDNLGDTSLCLDCISYGHSKITKNMYSQSNDDLSAKDDGCKLVLGLGPTPTSYCADYPTGGINKTKEPANLFSQILISGADSGMLKLGLSRANAEPVVAMPQGNHLAESPTNERTLLMPVVDEGSTSSKKSGGYMPSLLFAPRPENINGNKGALEMEGLFDPGSDDASTFPHPHFNHQLQFSPEPSATTYCSVDAISDPMVVGTVADPYHHHPKKCRFKGCSKGARGASGLCIAHGGGQRCQKSGCNKGAESRTAYCKAHGGGRRCQHLGCTKSAEGKTDFCIAHGGGRRCGHSGCTKAARGKSGLCIRHGGGKRCTTEGCMRSAEGQAGMCISHGGGRRCHYPGCNKGAQGSTLHCKAHGGGKRCIFEGCTKGAEGSTPLCKGHGGGKRCLFEGGGICSKSVHGGTDYCVAHGGGKRCAMPGCTKSARGRTDCCVRHGGGKRCRIEGCGKSAQGSTDFCKAHGGGKRCSWALGCEKFARGKSGLCSAHGSMMLSQQDCDVGKSESMIGSGLFRGIVSASTMVGKSIENERSSSGVSTISDESLEILGRKQPLIPSQVLVPLSMKSPSSLTVQICGDGEGGSQENNYQFAISEGRVHGGGLLSLLGGDLKNAMLLMQE